MDFIETEEQNMIREMVRGLRETLAPRAWNVIESSEHLWRSGWNSATTGLQGVTIPDEYGGNQVDSVSESIIVEELARVDPSFSVMYCVHVGLCSMTIALHGNEEQKNSTFQDLREMRLVLIPFQRQVWDGCCGLGCKAKISEDGSHYILNGEKMWVTNGASADIYVLFAKDVDHPEFGDKKHGGTTAFIVEKSFHGFTVGRRRISWEYAPVTHAR